MGISPRISSWTERRTLHKAFVTCLFIQIYPILIECWKATSREFYLDGAHFVRPWLGSSRSWGRGRQHHKQLTLRLKREKEVHFGNSNAALQAQYTEGGDRDTDGLSTDDEKVTRPSSELQTALQAAAQKVTSCEIGQLLQSRFLTAKGAIDRAALVRSLRAALDMELAALEDADTATSDASPYSRESDRQKLRDRLRGLRQQLSDSIPSQDESTECGGRRYVLPPFNIAESQAAKQRRFSWDSEQYSVREALGPSDGSVADTTRDFKKDASFVKLHDQLVREVVSLPTLLTADEMRVAESRLPRVLPASQAEGSLFQGQQTATNDPPVCYRRQYGLPELLEDLQTTCASLCNRGKQSDSCEGSSPPASASHHGDRSPEALDGASRCCLSLFKLFPNLSASKNCIGRLYCSQPGTARECASQDKRRGVVLLPGKLQAR